MSNSCYFCQRNIREIDFKNRKILEGFISASAKIKPRRRTKLCSKHQRQLARAIKRARFLGLLPYTPK